MGEIPCRVTLYLVIWVKDIAVWMFRDRHPLIMTESDADPLNQL